MENMEGRVFLTAAVAALPLALLGPSAKISTAVKIAPVAHGEDRLGEHYSIGVSSTAFKVLTDDSGGGLFVIEHASRKKGGPPRHLHHNENEWFYVLEGEYIGSPASWRATNCSLSSITEHSFQGITPSP